MRHALLAAISLLVAPVAAHAVEYVGAKGKCDKFVIAGETVSCGGVAIMSQTDNGRVQVQIPYGKDGLLMFSGVPDGEHNDLPAMAVDNISVGQQRFQAEGGCLLSEDGEVMFFGCDATDAQGRAYVAYFKGDIVQN